jgi:transcriptional regulator with XRE-family HTH domain
VADNRKSELGEFMRTRRAALTPDETGVPTYGTTRRVPGLRREEVALLAGVSANYYTRLEQGESHQISDQVLDAIAGALRLTDTERVYMRRLARPPQPVGRAADPVVIRDSLRSLVEANTDQVVYVIDRHMELLIGNRLAYALYGLRDGQPVNMARHMFLEPSMRDVMTDWDSEAQNLAASLRVSTGSHPDDPQLAELIGELSIKSPDFVRLWAAHPVKQCGHGVIEFDHPLVGHLALAVESLRVTEDLDQQVCFLSAEPGSDSAGRLRLLDSLVS